jgi:parallel beta-helix repeat protein
LAADTGLKTTSAAAAVVATGRIYYVDSQVGIDTANGLAATVGAAGTGPWRTLAKLAKASLVAGDQVVLACNSTWQETLVIRASGTAAKPISITTPTAGCTTGPVIDGGSPLLPTAWRQQKGQTYRATLSSAPLQLTGAGIQWPLAHHPNRGYNPLYPASPYVAMTSDGGSTTVSGRLRGTSLVIGAELPLPAGASIDTGTLVRIRTNAWTIEERQITSGSSGRYTLDTPTIYPIVKGWGYYLLGRPWMVDSVGEWAYDSTAGQVVAYMPGTTAPTTTIYATTLAVGIDLQGTSNVIVDGLTVRRVGTGANVRATTGTVLRALRIEDTAGLGIDAVGSVNATVASNQISRTGRDAIAGVGDGGSDAKGMTIRSNTISQSGVLVQNGSPASLPVRSFASIYTGPNAVVQDNSITDSGYIGIRYMASSAIERNVVTNSCLVLDDCGAIYTWGTTPNNSGVRNNVVRRVVGNLDGKIAGTATAAQGIYLDDYTSGATVENNTVIDADNGIQVHDAFNNTLRGNKLFANRRSQIWLQETGSVYKSTGDLYGNVIDGNHFGPTLAGAVALQLDTINASTKGFGTFSRNRYLDNVSTWSVKERTKAGSQQMSTAQWQASAGIGSTTSVDRDGFSQRALPYASYATKGANLVSNGSLASGLQGWTQWTSSTTAGTLVRETCPAGTCMRYVPGGAAGLISSPNFSVVAGQWYRLTIDIRADNNNQAVNLLVRRGGGANGYESLSDRSLALTAGTSWQRQSLLFQATKTVNRADPVTKDLGARVDIEGLTTGHSLSMANLELVAVDIDSTSLTIGSVVNASANPVALACPLATASQRYCTSMRRLTDLQLQTWPATVAAYSTELVYGLNASLVDSDNDGIPDSQDICPNTPAMQAVNAVGCPLGQ